MIHYKKGDLFANLPEDPVIIHVCNDIGIIGGGFTAPLIKYYPQVKDAYNWWFDRCPAQDVPFFKVSSKRPLLGTIQIVELYDLWVINMIAQQGIISSDNPVPLNYAALADCLFSVKAMVSQYKNIVCPLIGSQLAGGDWCVIQQLINEVFDDRDITVYVLNEEDLPEQFRHLLT